MGEHDNIDRLSIPRIAFCAERMRLLAEFSDACMDLMKFINEQIDAVIANDPDFDRFDALLHMASERKRAAKYAYIAHLQSHGCHEGEIHDPA